MQEIIAKIENFAKRFELAGEYNIHMDLEFSKQELKELKDFSLKLKPCVNEVSKFCEILNSHPQQVKIINSDDICHKDKLYLEWSYPRDHIPGLVLTDTCRKYVDLNEVLKLIKRL